MKVDRRKIELAMARACMNTPDLADKAEMAQSAIRYVIRGKDTSPRTIGKIAAALGVDPADLIED